MEIEVKEKPVKVTVRSIENRETDMNAIDCLSGLLSAVMFDPTATDGSVIPILNETGHKIVAKKLLEIVNRL